MARKTDMSMRVVDKGWKALKASMKEAEKEKPYSKVGFVGAKAKAEHEGGLTNGELAIIHEFGAPSAGIPARPFVSASFNKNRQKYIHEIANGLKDVYSGKKGMTLRRLMSLVGAQAAADIKAYVTQGPQVPPPNTLAVAARKAAKGTNGAGVRTLVDTGQMINAVTWEVVSGSERGPE